MAKRKSKRYLPQPMAEDIKRRFTELIRPRQAKDPLRKKYYAASVNPAYEKDEDLLL